MTYSLKLDPPAFMLLETSDGKSVQIDVFEARRMLFDEAVKKPSEQERWLYVRQWMSAKLDCPPESIAESNAWAFNDMIAAIVKKETEARTKNCETIACSRQSIPESQASIPSGQTT